LGFLGSKDETTGLMKVDAGDMLLNDSGKPDYDSGWLTLPSDSAITTYNFRHNLDTELSLLDCRVFIRNPGADGATNIYECIPGYYSSTGSNNTGYEFTSMGNNRNELRLCIGSAGFVRLDSVGAAIVIPTTTINAAANRYLRIVVNRATPRNQVIEKQLLAADGIRQTDKVTGCIVQAGGVTTQYTVNLPVPMADTDYTVIISEVSGSYADKLNPPKHEYRVYYEKTISSFKVEFVNTSSTDIEIGFRWTVIGGTQLALADVNQNYSSVEHPVYNPNGTQKLWINGKPIFEKTIYRSNGVYTLAQGTNVLMASVFGSATYADEIIKTEVVMSNQNDTWVMSGGHTHTGATISDHIQFFYRGASDELAYIANIALETHKLTITLQYTKNE
jgi:hypothetical protein